MISPVRLSVRLSVTRVDHTKTVEVRIMKFSPYGSPITLVFREQVSSLNSDTSCRVYMQTLRLPHSVTSHDASLRRREYTTVSLTRVTTTWQ